MLKMLLLVVWTLAEVGAKLGNTQWFLSIFYFSTTLCFDDVTRQTFIPQLNSSDFRRITSTAHHLLGRWILNRTSEIFYYTVVNSYHISRFLHSISSLTILFSIKHHKHQARKVKTHNASKFPNYMVWKIMFLKKNIFLQYFLFYIKMFEMY